MVVKLLNTDENENNLLFEIEEFKKNRKLRNPEKKQKRDTLESLNALYDGRKTVLDAFKSGIFPLLTI